MKLAIIAACSAFLFGVPAMADIELTKTGPGIYWHGGGGGP
jgi:hypothetical protein